MADGIRKPWLLSYLVLYAETHGGELLTSLPKRGKVQIINFRTIPQSSEEWVWADISDKQHVVLVRFTMESVQAFNTDPRNAGRRLTSRRWAVASIRCVRPLWCRPPIQTGKGLEAKWTLAVEVDQIDVAASEGEAMFGEPKCITKEEPIRRWIEGLRDSDGPGGNILRMEWLERERKEKEAGLGEKRDKNFETHQRQVHALLKPVEPKSRASRSNENLKAIERRQRSKKWKLMVEEIGLVQAYKCRKIPDDQVQRLNEITVFGTETLISDTSPTKAQSLGQKSSPREVSESHVSVGIEMPLQSTPRSSPRKPLSKGPTTPSQWAVSQGSNLDGEQDEGEDAVICKVDSPVNKDGYSSGEEDVVEDFQEQLQRNVTLGDDGAAEGKPDAVQRDSEDEMEVDEALEGYQHDQLLSSRKSATKAMGNSRKIPTPSRKLAYVAHKPIILAPDSDISGSQSHTQSQSLTQPSVSQPSTASQHDIRRATLAKLDLMPESSYPQKDQITSKPPLAAVSAGGKAHPDDVDNSELDSDDEAAQRIMVSNAANSVNHNAHSRDIKTRTVPPKTPLHVHANEGASRVLAHVHVNSMRTSLYTPHNPDGTRARGTKRTLEKVITSGGSREAGEPESKRRRRSPPGEVVVERVEHNIEAWREPSFTKSSKKKKTRHKEEATSEARKLVSDNVPSEVSYRIRPHKGVSHSASEAQIKAESDSQTQPTSATRATSHTRLDDRNVCGTRHTELDSAAAAIGTSQPSKDSNIANSQKDGRVKGLSHPHVSSAQTTNLDDTALRRKQQRLKLGGWRPRKDIASRPQMMTWGTFNNMLLEVGRARESVIQRNH